MEETKPVIIWKFESEYLNNSVWVALLWNFRTTKAQMHWTDFFFLSRTATTVWRFLADTKSENLKNLVISMSEVEQQHESKVEAHLWNFGQSKFGWKNEWFSKQNCKNRRKPSIEKLMEHRNLLLSRGYWSSCINISVIISSFWSFWTLSIMMQKIQKLFSSPVVHCK